MFDTTKVAGQRKSINKNSGTPSPKMLKRSAPNTPNLQKPGIKIQGEQKQTPKMNKNKRKSTPGNSANVDSASPIKPKIEPFLGTSDLFMDMKQEPDTEGVNIKKETGVNKKTPAKNNTKQETSDDGDDSAKVSGDRATRRLERVRARRTANKEKLKQTLIQAVSGNQDAITLIKERAIQLSKQTTLSISGKRKFKRLKKVLKDAGVDVSSINRVSTAQTVNKQEKQKQSKDVQPKSKQVQAQKAGVNVGKKKANTQQNKKQEVKKEIKEEDISEDDDEDGSEEEEDDDSENGNSLIEAESIEDKSDEEEDSDDEDDDDVEEEEDDAESSDEDDSTDELPSKKVKLDKKLNGKAAQNQANNTVSSLLKGKSRYVVFVGNLPFDVTKEEISQHFAKIGTVKDVRIPLDKQTNKSRGFGYVELLDQTAYEKALSLHHTNLKGRRVNVLYTQAGKKKGEEKKKEIKAKNFKLQAMRQEGKLTGSVKQSQKRAARREKRRSANKSN